MNLKPCHDADHDEVSWPDRVIDIGYALELLDNCVSDRGDQSPPRRAAVVSLTGPERISPAAGDSIVIVAMRKAGAPPAALSALRHISFTELYASGRPVLNLTLGAVVVFRAAQSAEQRGQTWAVAVQAAWRTASRFAELIPDRLASPAAAAAAPERPT
jgi:hypothetical protein